MHINEPFWSAWQRYGWGKPVPGIGISLKEINAAIAEERPISLTIGNDPTTYVIDPQAVLDIGEQYHSKKLAKGTILVVIPKSALLVQ